MKLRLDTKNLLVPVMAVLAAMFVGMLLIYGIGYDAMYAYSAMVSGAVGTPAAVGSTILRAAPIILTGLSVMVAFRAGLFNIGGQGQAIIGLLCAGSVAIYMDFLPGASHWIVALLAAVVGGGLWGALAGFLKVARGANEVVVTIMLNYIAIRFGEFLLGLGGPLQEKGSDIPASASFPESAQLPVFWRPNPFTEVHLGVVVALIAAGLVWFLIARTSLGYQIRAVGLQPEAAEYGGMSVTKVTVVGMFFAGALSGLGGAVATLGELERMQKSELGVLQIGFAGIAVALLGRNTAIGCVFAGLLMGALDSGAVGIQNQNALPSGVATKLIGVIQGLIVLFIGMDLLFRRYANIVHGWLGRGEKPVPEGSAG
ncbi:MAG: inner-rane translocator [Thermoleophilia bacterium]|nr:inner-rane translocator [Thermoleophilia bacterium]